MKLDKNQPYGQIFGDDKGRVYEQDNRFFRGDGSLWTDPSHKETAVEKKAREEADAMRRAAEENAKGNVGEAADQLAKQLAGSVTIGKT